MEDGCVERSHIEIDKQADANFDIESSDIKGVGDLRTAVRLRENTPAVKLPDYDFFYLCPVFCIIEVHLA